MACCGCRDKLKPISIKWSNLVDRRTWNWVSGFHDDPNSFKRKSSMPITEVCISEASRYLSYNRQYYTIEVPLNHLSFFLDFPFFSPSSYWGIPHSLMACPGSQSFAESSGDSAGSQQLGSAKYAKGMFPEYLL